MTPHPQPQYIVSKDDIDELILELEYHRYNNAKIIENRIRSHPHTPAAPAPEPNPCEENGCTDIENCDEICEHMKIYSPAYVRKARKDEREQVLNALEEFLNSDDHLSLFKWEVREQIRSLRGGAP